MLRTRVLTAVALAAALLVALFALPSWGWCAVATLILTIAAWEWWGFARHAHGPRLAYAAGMGATGAGLAWALGLWAGRPGALLLYPIYIVAVLFWILAVPTWLRRRPPAPPASLVLGAGVAVLIPTFLALVQLRNIQPTTLLLIMGTVWVADIAAFFAGRRFGAHKLAPHISPGKTWEGFYGAVIATACYAMAWVALAPRHLPALVRDLPGTIFWTLAVVEVLTVFAVLGDLFESAMKRQAGVKDSGRLLPGHGGVLDRVDALTATLPLAALVWMSA
ncbi:MAG: phosphatidate cytidylyltransferase [Betaproteobacteria bacterium]|jgi:phosphatidate cytidylyltransferase|nr:phosphatidate cytidylyltransferase [Betaproteobacteria bacterium]